MVRCTKVLASQNYRPVCGPCNSNSSVFSIHPALIFRKRSGEFHNESTAPCGVICGISNFRWKIIYFARHPCIKTAFCQRLPGSIGILSNVPKILVLLFFCKSLLCLLCVLTPTYSPKARASKEDAHNFELAQQLGRLYGRGQSPTENRSLPLCRQVKTRISKSHVVPAKARIHSTYEQRCYGSPPSRGRRA